MKKINARSILFFCISCMVLSSSIFMACNKKDVFTGDNQVLQKSIDKTIVGGRFVFSSKESLSETINQLNTEKTEQLEDKFEKFYTTGFRSHTPVVNPENKQLIMKLSEERKLKLDLLKNSNGTDEEFEFISDPFLAALVNENNEIIVNDTIYKFTKENGLFFAHLKDTTYLFDYIEKEFTSKENLKLTSVYVDPCETREELGGVTQVDDKILRYVNPDDCYVDGGSTGGGGLPPASEPSLQEIINSLPVCEGNRGNIIDGLFGESYDCTSYFDDRTRVKIEFWDKKWLIYASVGVVVKTQTRTLGIWWASKSDEIHLGISRILLKYNYNAPTITSVSHPSYFSLHSKAPLYLINGTFKIKEYFGSQSFVEAAITCTDNSRLPFFDFENREILNIYISEKNSIVFGSQDITSPANIKTLYQMGIDFLKAEFGSGVIPEFAVIYQKTTEEIEVLYFGEHYSETNENMIKHKFYSNLAFEIKYTHGDGDLLTRFSLETIPDSFRNYTHYELDFYGLAKRGNVWKGNRMVR